MYLQKEYFTNTVESRDTLSLMSHIWGRKMSTINICITKLPRDQHSISKFHWKGLKCWQQPPCISHVSWNSVFLRNPRIYWFVFHNYDCGSLYRGEGIHQKQWILCILFSFKKKKTPQTWLLFCMHILTLTLEETACLFDFFQMWSQQGSLWLWICKMIWNFFCILL